MTAKKSSKTAKKQPAPFWTWSPGDVAAFNAWAPDTLSPNKFYVSASPGASDDGAAIMRELDKCVIHDLIMGATDTPQAIERVADWHQKQKSLWYRVYKSLNEIAARKE